MSYANHILETVFKSLKHFVPYIHDKTFEDYIITSASMLNPKSPTKQTPKQIEAFADEMTGKCYDIIIASDFMKGIIKHLNEIVVAIAPYLGPRELLNPNDDLFLKPSTKKSKDLEKIDLTNAEDVNVFIKNEAQVHRIIKAFSDIANSLEHTVKTVDLEGPQTFGGIPIKYTGNCRKYERLKTLDAFLDDLHNVVDFFEHLNSQSFVYNIKPDLDIIVSHAHNMKEASVIVDEKIKTDTKTMLETLEKLITLASKDDKYTPDELYDMQTYYKCIKDFIAFYKNDVMENERETLYQHALKSCNRVVDHNDTHVPEPDLD